MGVSLKLDVRDDPGAFSLFCKGSRHPQNLNRDVLQVPRDTDGIEQPVGEEAKVIVNVVHQESGGATSWEKLHGVTSWESSSTYLSSQPFHS